MTILFVCTSQKDRSPCLERHFRKKFPLHEYRSAGINKYHTTKKGTHYITQEDIDWADLIVYAEDIHRKVVGENFTLAGKHEMICAILNCGSYTRGSVGEEYLSCAESKLNPMLYSGGKVLEDKDYEEK